MSASFAVLDSIAHAAASLDATSKIHANHVRGTLLMQQTARVCDSNDPACSSESVKLIVLLSILSTALILVLLAFTFFREDKEEQITPLCPQLVVKENELNFQFEIAPEGMSSQGEDISVLDSKQPSPVLCKISADFPDPFRGSSHGVAATVRVHNRDMTLATVVARNVSVSGQGLALCRTGCEIFGFVEAVGDKYHVRHRTGVQLLTFVGDFDDYNVQVYNPVGAMVCSLRKKGNTVQANVIQHVDAGLVLCSLMATQVHRKLSLNASPSMTAAGARPQSVVRGPQSTTPQSSSKEALLQAASVLDARRLTPTPSSLEAAGATQQAQGSAAGSSTARMTGPTSARGTGPISARGTGPSSARGSEATGATA